jgi:transcriptional antiterminator Rof (Rho-off)
VYWPTVRQRDGDRFSGNAIPTTRSVRLEYLGVTREVSTRSKPSSTRR